MPTGAESAAGLVALIIAGVLADAVRPNGHLRGAIGNALRKKRQANGAHEAIPDVVEKLETIDEKQDQVYHKVEEIDTKTDRNAYLIREFHGDGEVNVSVDDILDDDPVFRGGEPND